MIRMILAAAAAFALVSAVPAFACPDCHDCPQHKDKVAAADKAADKKDADKKTASCGCVKDGGTCKCGDKCTCANCPVHGKKGEKAEKKS